MQLIARSQAPAATVLTGSARGNWNSTIPATLMRRLVVRTALSTQQAAEPPQQRRIHSSVALAVRLTTALQIAAQAVWIRVPGASVVWDVTFSMVLATSSLMSP